MHGCNKSATSICMELIWALPSSSLQPCMHVFRIVLVLVTNLLPPPPQVVQLCYCIISQASRLLPSFMIVKFLGTLFSPFSLQFFTIAKILDFVTLGPYPTLCQKLAFLWWYVVWIQIWDWLHAVCICIPMLSPCAEYMDAGWEPFLQWCHCMTTIHIYLPFW